MEAAENTERQEKVLGKKESGESEMGDMKEAEPPNSDTCG